VGAMSVDSWYRSRQDLFRDKFLQEALQTGTTKEKALEEANRKSEEFIQTFKVKLTASSDRLNTSTNNVNELAKKIDNINQELTTEPKNIELLKTKSNYYREMYQSAVKQQEADIKEIQSLSTIEDPNIVKSDLSELFNNFIDNISNFLSTLTSEQLVIVFNIMGYTMLLSTLNSITIILLGDQIINWLNLEIKYPKLAKFIKFKQILNKHSLRFNIVFFYLLILSLISINLYMFLYDYLLQL
jgi:intracellular sulfur oxidation DsrE/DsrF family protein